MEPQNTISTAWYEKTWLVIVTCLLFFPVGLYALWKNSFISKGWKIGGTALIALAFIIGVTDKKGTASPSLPTIAKNETEKAAPEEKTEKVEVKSVTTSEKYLFKTPDDFKEAFNKYSASNSLGFEIDELKVTEGEVQNTFQYMITGHLGLIGTVNKADGSVKEINMIGSGDGTTRSATNILLCMGAIIGTVDPAWNLRKEESS